MLSCLKKANLIKGFIGVTVFMMIFMSFSSVSNAAVSLSNEQSDAIKEANKVLEDVEVSQEKVDKLAADLEFLFEEATTRESGKYVIVSNKKDEIKDRFGQENLTSIEKFVKMVNAEEIEPSLAKAGPVLASSYIGCLKDSAVDAYGAVYKVFFTGAIGTLIAQGSYADAAGLISKAALKVGLRVSIATLAVELSWWSIKCSFFR